MTFRRLFPLVLVGFAAAQPALAEPSVEIVKREDVQFIPLNPARGDASPQAGVLWGDIRKDMPTGTLIKFADGFASPPHIHNITYRAVVISGTVHNDDPAAENMWMPPGSFWTQPAGEVHITSVGPGGGTAFLEILTGPYLVRPMAEAFDNGERPINVDEANVVWLDATDVTWVEQDQSAKGAEISFLWGNPKADTLNGTFLKLPAGFSGTIDADGASLKAVIVQGDVTHSAGALSASQSLEVGSYFGSEDQVIHEVSCGAEDECLLYVRTVGTYQLTAAS